MEDDVIICIKIMLASSITDSAIRVHKGEKVRSAMPSIMKRKVECAEDCRSN